MPMKRSSGSKKKKVGTKKKVYNKPKRKRRMVLGTNPKPSRYKKKK